MLKNKYLCMIAGSLTGLVFAPVFFIPFIVIIGVLCHQIRNSVTYKDAIITGFIFGFGHFLTGLYWISIAIGVYIDEFWWMIPFALFGLPIILSCFTAIACLISWYNRNSKYYQIIFCICWVFFEWVRSWIFTGFPWNLLGYAFSFSDSLIQIASVIGVYGLSFVAVYIATTICYLLEKDQKSFRITSITSIIILLILIIFGALRLLLNPTQFLPITVRLVQPSIEQVAKWSPEQFWLHIERLTGLSTQSTEPDLIIWPEAALIVPYTYKPLHKKLLSMLDNRKSVLLTGGITDNNKINNERIIYASLFALNNNGELLFEYHKSHLVPFGEYMPLKKLLPFKKLTDGFLDYTEGKREIVRLDALNLSIKPLICYESIFSEEVRSSNQIVDVIVNVTNDAWYGNSSGPYQHLHISRMRAIENGLPMIRVANNGISAIIDPLGRIVKKLNLNDIGFIDGNIPTKFSEITLYSRYNMRALVATVLFVLLLQFIVTFIVVNKTK